MTSRTNPEDILVVMLIAISILYGNLGLADSPKTTDGL